MIRHKLAQHLVVVALVLASSIALSGARAADHLDNDDLSRVWSRLDQPVLNGLVSRTWFWGPDPITGLHEEPYADAPDGTRLVIYFDKTRMEINPKAESGSIWRITNGLLATELITGQVQLGDETFVDATSPEISVAGDPDDERGPTYRTLSSVLDADPLPEGTLITQTLSRSGDVGTDQSYGKYDVTAEHYVSETDHTVASVFWDYLRSRGTIYHNGEYLEGPLFENHLYGVGYPLTEAYWTTVRVAGEDQPVLVQAFQRRILTYTPNNPDGWKVEAGNVGRHYRDWRMTLHNLTTEDNSGPKPGHEDKKSGDVEKGDGSKSDECNQKRVDKSDNGTVKQSNEAVIEQDGSGDKKVICNQTNKSVQR
ncbi:MAG: hypothetical protein ACOC9Y_08085 [Chloroflexota bacterium]